MDAVADLRGHDALQLILALEQSRRRTIVLFAIVGFVRSVAAVVLFVAFPPEWNAFVSLFADKLRSGAVGQARVVEEAPQEVDTHTKRLRASQCSCQVRSTMFDKAVMKQG